MLGAASLAFAGGTRRLIGVVGRQLAQAHRHVASVTKNKASPGRIALRNARAPRSVRYLAAEFAPLFTNTSRGSRKLPRTAFQPYKFVQPALRSSRPARGPGLTRTPFASHVGLGSARTFASGPAVSAFASVPVGIRAIILASTDVDELRSHSNKRRKVVALDSSLQRGVDDWRRQVTQGSPRNTISEVSECFDSPRSGSIASVARASVRLTIPLEPTLPDASLVDAAHGIFGDIRDLEDVAQLLALHTNRVRNLADRLERAGILTSRDEIEVHANELGSAIVLDLPSPWTSVDVRQALGLWGNEELWFEMDDLSSEVSTSTSTSDRWHEQIADTLLLPSMTTDAPTEALYDDTSQLDAQSPTHSRHRIMATI